MNSVSSCPSDGGDEGVSGRREREVQREDNKTIIRSPL